jgi:hypothetical protein
LHVRAALKECGWPSRKLMLVCTLGWVARDTLQLALPLPYAAHVRRFYSSITGERLAVAA